MSLEIKGFIETSLLDWDGKIVSTLYLSNCNFKCPFCHNSGLIEDPCQYETVPIDHIKDFLIKRKDFIDGICVTGGEPCLHKNNGLPEFLKEIKDLGFQIKLDTNGTDPSCVKELFDKKLIDYIAMDLKAPLDERYNKLAGVEVELDDIKNSVKLIMSSNIDYEFRMTVVPTLLTKKDVVDAVKDIKGAKKFAIQQFVPENSWDKSLREVKPYSKDELEKMMEESKQYVGTVLLRGIKDLQ